MAHRRWQDEISDLFAARADPALTTARCPQLTLLAAMLTGSEDVDDTALRQFIRSVIAFLGELDGMSRDWVACAAGGAAFLYVDGLPRRADQHLIAKGNGRRFDGDFTSKKARDTWAYLTYKRTLLDGRRDFFSYKPGALRRHEFCAGLVAAIEQVEAAPEEFRLVYDRVAAAERSAYGIEFEDKQDGTASSGTRRDRSTATDVNYPDGSMVGYGQHFDKIWAVTNIGEVPWYGRRLTRVTPQGPTFPSSPAWVPIPDTLPGQTVYLTVSFIAGRVQGFSEVRFKMTDEHGNQYFPSKYPHGLTLIVETGPITSIDRKLP
ncbi:NBR1-Ig-like domain-containing protein [Microbacterium sp. ASV81]|uniref:NBR1-Ig-like domain-containing protein n=1 Tax=Microbacterium capsulatum TaxID=3041921 RepID=A0ABU0XF67_9MICO|nr:NBR1-Ig-like domain-containing protein [Microbacterium sp. ASV81]MDQ4213745.1 NBR1-Ig-like domain-containing protein [Microbacterium sp. ASV81]